MKPKYLIASLFVTFLFTSAMAQDFEGVIKLKNSASEGINAIFTIKGDKVLMEAKAEQGTVKMLTNKKTGIFYTLADSDGDKMAVKNDMNSPMMKMALKHTESNPNSMREKVDIQVSSETKTISGYNCIKINGNSEQAEGYAWVAKKLKINLADLFPMAQIREKDRFDKRMESALGTEGFVMELYSKDKKTGKEFTMTAEVEEKSVDLDEATVLEGYEVLDMTDMMKIMQEAQNDPEKMEKLKKMMQKREKNN